MAEQEQYVPGETPPSEGGGIRGAYNWDIPSERMPSGLTAVQEQRLLKQALKGGWIKEARWPTGSTPADLQKKSQSGTLSIREMAIAAAVLDMPLADKEFEGKSERAQSMAKKLRQTAVRNVIAMESQNQLDDLNSERLDHQKRMAASLTDEAAEAIITQCVEVVNIVAGPEQAESVLKELSKRITVETQAVGTTLTPDQEAMLMDATIPSCPQDDRADHGEPEAADAAARDF